MPVYIKMRDNFEEIPIQGGFQALVADMNLQMHKGMKLIALQLPDDTPIAINVDNINSIRAESLEDAFFDKGSKT